MRRLRNDEMGEVVMAHLDDLLVAAKGFSRTKRIVIHATVYAVFLLIGFFVLPLIVWNWLTGLAFAAKRKGA